MLKKLVALGLLTTPLLSDPNFGGTLLSSIPQNAAPGTWFVEPYLYITHQYGTYTSHWGSTNKPNYNFIQLQWDFETGITPWLDIAFYPNFFYTDSSFRLGDTQIALGLQALTEKSNRPSLRFIIQESFPSGKFDRLKRLSEATGVGAYQTWFSSVLYKTLVPFTVNLSLDYILSSKVSPRGLNIYTTAKHATLRPGAQFISNLGIEYSLTQTTILGFDFHYLHQNSSTLPSTEQFSFASCIEYNPSSNFYFEIGPWFTVAGRNAPIFISLVVDAYWIF